MQFHERLYELRKNSGLTQNELAEKLDVSRQAISRWEMGTAKPEIENLIALSEIFGVSLDYLLKGQTSGGETHQTELPNSQERPAIPWKRVGFFSFDVFLGLWIFFSVYYEGELGQAFWTTAAIYAIIAAVVGVVCLTSLAVREVFRRIK